METIIGLLFILLPVIFKLIEKKLQNAGNEAKAGQIREFAEKYLGTDDDDHELEDVRKWFEGNSEQEIAEEAPAVLLPMEEPAVVELPAEKTPAMEPLAVKTPAVEPLAEQLPIIEHSTEQKKEKIDPKKLVIYSEIMKPKYNS